MTRQKAVTQHSSKTQYPEHSDELLMVYGEPMKEQRELRRQFSSGDKSTLSTCSGLAHKFREEDRSMSAPL